MNQLGKIKLKKDLKENNGQYTGITEVLERVMSLDTESIPRMVCFPAGPFPIKAFSSPGREFQAKLSPPGLRLNLLAVQPLYIPLC